MMQVSEPQTRAFDSSHTNQKISHPRVASLFHVEENGLRIDSPLRFSQWTAIGLLINRRHHAHLWAIGDWLNEGEARFGEKYVQAVNDFDYQPGTLRNHAYVAHCFPCHARVTKLSWTHHQAVASLVTDGYPDVAADMLQRALAGRWTRDDMRQAAKAIRISLGLDKPDELPAPDDPDPVEDDDPTEPIHLAEFECAIGDVEKRVKAALPEFDQAEIVRIVITEATS